MAFEAFWKLSGTGKFHAVTIPLILAAAGLYWTGVGVNAGLEIASDYMSEQWDALQEYKAGVDRTPGMGTFIATPLIAAAATLSVWLIFEARLAARRRAAATEIADQHPDPWLR